jgi:ABC-type transporter Mla MlaB component
MRVRGRIEHPSGLGRQDHACWVFETDEDLSNAAVSYLREGLEDGQRLLYVGGKTAEGLRSDISRLGDLDALAADGILQVATLTDLYDLSRPIDPAAQLAAYAAATEQALADGFTGLRVAAEVTQLVSDPAKHESHKRWESYADWYMTSNPLNALCLFDRRTLDDDLLADLACVHPASRTPDHFAPFTIAPEGDSLYLLGEVDRHSADALERVLGLVVEAAPGDAPTLDLERLSFIDHYGALALGKFTEGRRLTLANPPYLVRRLSDLLELNV